jgi:hypothetical protein
MIPKHGLIVYINAEETKVDLIKPSWMEVRALILSRNKLAGLIRDASTVAASGCGTGDAAALAVPLAPMLHSAFDCQHCYQASECMAYHGALEGGTAASSGAGEVFTYALRGVTPKQLLYLKRWDELITLEANAAHQPADSFAWVSPSHWILGDPEAEAQLGGEGEGEGERGLLLRDPGAGRAGAARSEASSSCISGLRFGSCAVIDSSAGSSRTVGARDVSAASASAASAVLPAEEDREGKYLLVLTRGGAGAAVAPRVLQRADGTATSAGVGAGAGAGSMVPAASPASFSDSAPSSLGISDRVTVSVEGAQCSSMHAAAAGAAPSSVDVYDIEDFGRPVAGANGGGGREGRGSPSSYASVFRTTSHSVMFTDPNLCSGCIVALSPTEVHLVVSELPKRLLE